MGNLARITKAVALDLVGMDAEQVSEALSVPNNVRMKIALWRAFEELRRDEGLIFRWDKGRIVTVDDPEKIARAAGRGVRTSQRKLARQAEKIDVAAQLTTSETRALQLDGRAAKIRRQVAMARLIQNITPDEAAAVVAHAVTSPRGKPKT